MGGWGYIFFRKFTLVTFLKVWPSWHMFPVLYPRDILHFYFYPRDITHSTLVTFLFSPSWQGWGYIFFSLTLVTFLPWPSWHKDYIPSWHKKQLPSWLYILTPLCTVIKWKSPIPVFASVSYEKRKPQTRPQVFSIPAGVSDFKRKGYFLHC